MAVIATGANVANFNRLGFDHAGTPPGSMVSSDSDSAMICFADDMPFQKRVRAVVVRSDQESRGVAEEQSDAGSCDGTGVAFERSGPSFRIGRPSAYGCLSPTGPDRQGPASRNPQLELAAEEILPSVRLDAERIGFALDVKSDAVGDHFRVGLRLMSAST